MAAETMLALAGRAALYSCLASSGFVIAVLVAWLILSRLAPGSRPVGSFGKFMILLESIDSIPEAMIIADATASGRMTLAFAFSIFSLNMANTMATALDFLATKPEKILHRLLLTMIFFSVGSLSFSISSTVFSSFLEHLAEGTYTWINMIPMMFGVVIGALLIWLLMFVEERLHRKALATEPVGAQAEQAEDVLAPMRLSLEREEHHLQTARQSEYESEDYRKKVVEYYEDRVAKIKALIASLESVNSLRDSLALPITQDAREVVEDSIYDQLGKMEHTYLLAQRAPQGESLNRRALRLLAIMTVLVLWAVLLTFSFTPLFAYLDQGAFSSYVNSFAEGLSGGAFLATISSTMIPRIQQDAYRSHWSRFAFRSIGMIAFISGVVFAVLLESAAVVPHGVAGNSTGH
jgi:hypothetical protein